MDTRKEFRKLLDSDEMIHSPGCFDGISAKTVESLGYRTASIVGHGVSNSRLGKPDVGILDLTSNIGQVKRIAQAVDIPLHADIDTGYGNALNVYNTVSEFDEIPEVVSLQLEDQEWPKRCGHMEGKSVIEVPDMISKIEAAVEARSDPNLLIKARTDAAGPLGIEEAIERMNRYSDAGADVVFADALLTEEDIEHACKETKAPLAVNMGFGIRKRPTTPLVSPNKLEELGVEMVSYPRLITASSMQGMKNALESLNESIDTGEVVERPEQAVSFEEYTSVMGLPEYYEMESKFNQNR